MSAEKGKMTPEDLAGLIYEKIIQENSIIYKDVYFDGYRNEATDPYMRRAFDFVSRLSESDRQTLLLMMRQVMVDTSSSLLAMFDGGPTYHPTQADSILLTTMAEISAGIFRPFFSN